MEKYSCQPRNRRKEPRSARRRKGKGAHKQPFERPNPEKSRCEEETLKNPRKTMSAREGSETKRKATRRPLRRTGPTKGTRQTRQAEATPRPRTTTSPRGRRDRGVARLQKTSNEAERVRQNRRQKSRRTRNRDIRSPSKVPYNQTEANDMAESGSKDDPTPGRGATLRNSSTAKCTIQ